MLPLGVATALVLLAVATTLASTPFQPGLGHASFQDTGSAIPPVPRPIFIYGGACGSLGNVAWPLNNLISPDGIDGGWQDVDRTEYSFTANVPLTIQAMMTSEYAINVHESADHPEHALTCGNIGGVPDSVGTLVIGLRSQGDVDVTGIAVLSPSPADASMTLVSVFISGSSLGDAIGTIGVTPAPVADDDEPDDDNPPIGVTPTVDDEPDDDNGNDDDGDDDGDDHGGDDNSGEGGGDDNSGEGGGDDSGSGEG